MSSMLCNVFTDLWNKFSYWVTVEWKNPTFIIVVSIFAILGTMGVLAFLKGPKYNKDKKPFRWGSLILGLLMFGLMTVLILARFA